MAGLCIFLGVARNTWTYWKKDKDIENMVAQVEEVIRTQKFEGAAADLFNASLIARELGLTDKSSQEITHSFGQLSDDELDMRIKALEDDIKSKS